jgi:hypothetical protein
MSADMNYKAPKAYVKVILPPKKETVMIFNLRQLCLDLPEDPSCGGYLYEDQTLF